MSVTQDMTHSEFREFLDSVFDTELAHGIFSKVKRNGEALMFVEGLTIKVIETGPMYIVSMV